MIRHLRTLLLLALVATGFVDARVHAAAPLPGTLIRNQARVHSFNADAPGNLGVQVSNIVPVLVGSSPAISLAADRAQTLTPGAWFSLAHVLTNTGNQSGAYTLTPANLGGDFAFESLALVIDSNEDGVAGSGEPAYAFGGAGLPYTVTLPPGGYLRVVLYGQVSPLATAGQARLRLTAALPSAGLAAVNTDTLSIGSGPVGGSIQFTKTANKPAAARGETIDYTLSGSNQRPVPVGTIPVTIDGAAANVALVRDVIPVNTTFVRFLGALAPLSTRLYHLHGAPEHDYVTAPPADLSTVDAVAVGYSSLPPGTNFSVTFRARVNLNAANIACAPSPGIVNIGEFHYHDGTQIVVLRTNGVDFTVPQAAAAATFYLDSNFTRPTKRAHLGRQLWIAVDAAAENADPLQRDTLTVRLKSRDTRDQESFTAVETGPNTGVFRVVIADTDTPYGLPVNGLAANRGDGAIQSGAEDMITLTIQGACSTSSDTATLLVDPSGIVFDSQSCQPIPGVWVSLVDTTGQGLNDGTGGPANSLAEVYSDALGTTRAANPVQTDADGRYEFPFVYDSTYRLVVSSLDPGAVPPSGTNIIPPSGLPPAPCSASLKVGIGSRQEPFIVAGADVFLDIPLDIAINGGGFGLVKEASRETVERGDSLTYTLTATNATAIPFLQLAIDDVLPQGLTYEPGSARVDGVKIADPSGGRGPRLTFLTLADLAPGGRLVLTYRVRVERDARSGRATNTALARSTAGLSARSLTTTKTVDIEEGVFTDKGIVIGKVFVDVNRNRVQDDTEPGVPGVRLYLEDGTHVVSDSEGKYSLYGLRPVAHVLKLDRTTLPPGAEPIVIDTRNAGDPGSRFVDLKRGELHKANFALDGGDPAVLAEVARRRSQGEVHVAEIETSLRKELERDGRPSDIGDPRSREASGVIGSGARDDNASPVGGSAFNALLPAGTLTSANSNLTPAPVRRAATASLESVVETLPDNQPGFLTLKNGDTLPGRQINVAVKGPLGAKFSLLLNGSEVSAGRVGKRVADPLRQIEAWEYIGVDLRPGENTFEFVVRDPFGNERARVPAVVTAPDRLARIRLAFSNSEPVADGRTPVIVTVALVDEAGTPVSARTPLTLEVNPGRWQVEDLNLTEPGVQTFIEGGRAEFTLLPPDSPGDGRVVVSSGAIKQEALLPYLPDLRPLIASGILEGTLFMRDGANLSLRPVNAGEAFEEELRKLAASDDVRTGGRAAFFLKGKIKGDVLLTAAYDSDKDTKERLFRDIEPDAYYPVYGDSSLRGYDAQSTRRLYVRVDHKRSYLLLGDFQTTARAEQAGLGNYQRSLNGVKGHYETSRVSADAWASRDTTVQVVQEIPADGTSGPYRFKLADGLINSEKVEIITRDRNQRSLVLSVEPMTRFTDYNFEPFTGHLLFNAPVRSLDPNLNPRYIRITYERDQGGDPFWVYGGNAQVRVTDRIEVGGTAARDENPLDQQQLSSANTTVRLAENTYLLGEVAQSETDLAGTGLAGRVDLRHKTAKTDARVFYGETADNFTNPGSLLTAGRIESGAKATRILDEKNTLVVQAIHTEDTATDAGGYRHGVRGDVIHAFDNGVTLEAGGRVSRETGGPAGPTTVPNANNPSTPGGAAITPFEVNSLRLKLGAPVPKWEDATIYGEYEQDVLIDEQRLAALGGDWQFSDRGRLYFRHEFISALGGPFELNENQQNNITVFGVETDYMKDGRVFNEYRARDSFNGREAEAATGLRNQFTLSPGLRLTASLERVTPFDGTTTNESTAVSTGVEYTDNPLWKGTARVELRFADQSDSLLNTLGYARKLNRDWTFLGKTIYYDVNNHAPGSLDTLSARVLSGLAWRQTGVDRWNVLTKHEFRYEDGSPFSTNLDELRRVNIGSVSVNYQPVHDWIFSTRYAVKYVDEVITGDHATYFGHQIGFRALYEISKHWDAGLSTSLGWSRDFDRHDWAIGPEIGYSFKTNLRLGLGYNVVGFNDRDLSGDIPTQQGVFINLRLKFDEHFFGLRNLASAGDPARTEASK